MSVEEKIKNCDYNLKQINHFNPDPFYVNYFFKAYLQSVNEVYDKIFEESNRDFGLFVSGKCTKEKLRDKAKEKKDSIALKFLSWFEENYEEEHSGSYPNFIKKSNHFLKKFKRLPKIIIKIQPSQIYKDDFFQSIQVGLTKGKIRSREELEIEIKRQRPVFLEIINQKRKDSNEPLVSQTQIKASAYLDLKNYENVEISHVCEIYLPVMRRILDDSRKEIKKLTSWTD